MRTEDLVNQAQAIMARYVCRDLSGRERVAMQRLVERFFAERAGRLSPSEIMDHLATPMQALAWFSPFLCQTYWKHCCTDGLPHDEAACQLA